MTHGRTQGMGYQEDGEEEDADDENRSVYFAFSPDWWSPNTEEQLRIVGIFTNEMDVNCKDIRMISLFSLSTSSFTIRMSL